MKVTPLDLEGLKLIELPVYSDHRGFFMERYNQKRFRENGFGMDFVQDNHSRSAPGVLRGLHYQSNPAQGKLVGVLRGRIWDVAVDIRRDSPTYGRHVAVELDGDGGKFLWVPGGFAHGFCVISQEPADVMYKVDCLYDPKNEGGIHWGDPILNIRWPVAKPVVSLRDDRLPGFAVYREHPVF